MERIYLHIGMGKTGTKSIQRGLHSIRDQLAERGVSCPEGVRGNHGPSVGSLFVDDPVSWSANARWRRSAEDVARDNEATRRNLERELDSNPRAMILSGEAFFTLPRTAIERMLTWIHSVADDFRIIVYLREPRSWAVSYVQQAMKRGQSLESVLSQRIPVPLIRERLSRWIAQCGNERIWAFDFGAARRHRFSVGGHFIEQIGFPEFAPAMDLHVNPSLSVEALAEIAALTQERSMRLRGEEIENIGAKHAGGSKIVLPDHVLSTVAEIARPDVEWLAKEFNVRLTA